MIEKQQSPARESDIVLLDFIGFAPTPCLKRKVIKYGIMGAVLGHSRISKGAVLARLTFQITMSYPTVEIKPTSNL